MEFIKVSGHKDTFISIFSIEGILFHTQMFYLVCKNPPGDLYSSNKYRAFLCTEKQVHWTQDSDTLELAIQSCKDNFQKKPFELIPLDTNNNENK